MLCYFCTQCSYVLDIDNCVDDFSKCGRCIVKRINWIIEHKIWAGMIGFGLFLLPILMVHTLFKISAPCKWLVPNWTAGDVLLYCGAVLGASATILAIILTIIFTQKNQKDERRLSIKPHLQTEHQPIFNTDKAISQVSNKAVFVIFPHNESESIGSTYEPPYILRKPEETAKEREIISVLDFSRRYYIIQYTLSNVGAGSALNMSFTIDDKVVIPPFSLRVNDAKVFVIILKAELLKETTRSLRFKYEYQDVASIAQYEQHETIVLFKEGNGSLNSRQLTKDVISQPREIKGGHYGQN